MIGIGTDDTGVVIAEITLVLRKSVFASTNCPSAFDVTIELVVEVILIKVICLCCLRKALSSSKSKFNTWPVALVLALVPIFKVKNLRKTYTLKN